MTSVTTLRDLLLYELKDLYSAEQQLLTVLPRMEIRATNQKLRAAIRSHYLETRHHTKRLEEIGVLLRTSLSGKESVAMKGLVLETTAVLMKESNNDALVDLLLIGAAKRIEHYEMAAYSTTRAMSLELGEREIASLLSETLDEELNLDEKLSWIAGEEVILAANVQPNFREELEMNPLSYAAANRSRRLEQATRMLGLFVALVLTTGSVPESAQAKDNEQQVTREMGTAKAQPAAEREAAQSQPDDTGRNARDSLKNHATADDQKLSGPDVDVLARLRSEIVKNESLSTNGHNVKIIIENQKVTLRGPVATAAERTWIQETATRIATGYNVVNNLEVTGR